MSNAADIIKDLNDNNKKLVDLSLSGVIFTQNEFDAFCTAFAKNTSLSTLSFTGCPLIFSIIPFFAALKENKHLTSLSFRKIPKIVNYLDELNDALCSNKTLRSLDLSSCKINLDQLEELTFLTSNRTLLELNMGNNRFTARGAKFFAKQLKYYPEISQFQTPLKDEPNQEPVNDTLLKLNLEGKTLDKSIVVNSAPILQGIKAALEKNEKEFFIRQKIIAAAKGDGKPAETIQIAASLPAQTEGKILSDCSVLLVSSEKDKREPILTQEAYIRFDTQERNQLFYFKKEDKEKEEEQILNEIKLSNKQLAIFDEKMEPSVTPKILTEEKLKELLAIITPPKDKTVVSNSPQTERKKELTASKATKQQKKQSPSEMKQDIKLTFLDNSRTHFKPIYTTVKHKPPETASSHIRKMILKFAASTSVLGIISIAVLVGLGLVASGPPGWIMMGTILGACLLAGVIIGAVTGAITIPKKKEMGDELNTFNSSHAQLAPALSEPKPPTNKPQPPEDNLKTTVEKPYKLEKVPDTQNAPGLRPAQKPPAKVDESDSDEVILLDRPKKRVEKPKVPSSATQSRGKPYFTEKELRGSKQARTRKIAYDVSKGPEF